MEKGVEVAEVPLTKRESLDSILQESFEGWYLRHSMKTLQEVETVKAAYASGTPVGLIMLKTLDAKVGYVYYVAVRRESRQTGVGSLLLADALKQFTSSGITEVFASVEHDNVPSEKLFESHGFTRTSFSEVSGRHGPLHALNMYRMMVVVPGEVLLHRSLG
ncbi:MAG TPA: GNAT family N-acetyltransferase [Nitrososphaerales archaeon]|nr:GNAT family N-acetyltransferase [Nitrososphaerales archaeon]